MHGRLERVLNTVLTIAAAATAVAVVRREFLDHQRQAVAAIGLNEPPKFVREWKAIVAHGGTVVEAHNPAVILVEFGDLECPFCKRFHEQRLQSLRRKFPGEIGVAFVHFPLPGHRFAVPAARAAECAASQARFAEFVAAVYAKQDSLGLKSWTSYAVDAGIRDTSKLRECSAETSPLARVDSGAEWGRRIGVRGTPGIMVNGWLFLTPPSDSLLESTVTALLKRQVPFAPKSRS